MFEYLMPMLVMPSYEGTLLDETCRAAVQRQIEYGRRARLPWGISESGYNAVDAAQNYLYRAFGVPGLGLQRGLHEERRRRAVRVGAGADGRARGRMPQPAAAREGRHAGPVRPVRGGRLHAVAPAAAGSRA